MNKYLCLYLLYLLRSSVRISNFFSLPIFPKNKTMSLWLVNLSCLKIFYLYVVWVLWVTLIENLCRDFCLGFRLQPLVANILIISLNKKKSFVYLSQYWKVSSPKSGCNWKNFLKSCSRWQVWRVAELTPITPHHQFPAIVGSCLWFCA